MIDNNKIVAALSRVIDPQTGRDIISVRMVRDLKIEGSRVSFTLDVAKYTPEMKSAVNFSCIAEIQKDYPDCDVNIHVEGQDNEKPRSILPQVKNIIAVASGKGGVGKSTVAVNTAISLANKGYRVGLIDADLYGPSIPTMMGLQGSRPKVEVVHGKHKLIPLEAFGVKLMSIGFIVEPEQAVVLRGPRLAGIIKQFIQDCIWPDLDFLIIDLPPGTGDIQLTLVQTLPITGALLVTTPQEVALIDAVKAANMFMLDSVNVPILGVVENMSWFTPAELPENRYFLFGRGGGEKLASFTGCKLLGQIPLVQSIGDNSDVGRPAASSEESGTHLYFSKITDQLLQQVELRNTNLSPTEIVKITTT